jgi:hypothetical protein
MLIASMIVVLLFGVWREIFFCCVFIEVLMVMWNSMVINGVCSCKRIGGGVCGLSCNAIRFGFHVFFFFFSMQDMSILILISRFQGLFCVLCVYMLWEMNVMTNKWCTSFMKAWFHNLGTHKKTFWLRICKGLLHYDKKVMYNLFVNYTHSNICTERNMSASWNSKCRVWNSIYTFELIFKLYLSF